MPTYRFADVKVRIGALSSFANTLFEEYRADEDAFDEDLSIDESDIDIEAAVLHAPREVLEVRAVLRKLAALLPARYDGFVLHASSVVYDGKAYAFVAPPGTGKTTHARVWVETLGDNARILNGDRLLVRWIGDRFLAYGNPWKGKEGLGEKGSYPLGGVYFLSRAEQNTLAPIAPMTALTALMSASAVSKHADERFLLLGLLDKLLKHVPYSALSVNRRPDAVLTALSGLEEST